MTNIPEKIFLQIGDDCPDDASFKELSEVCWCSDNVFGNDIPYIHEDVYKASISTLEFISEKLGESDAEIEILKENGKYQSIDFARWLSKNNWHYYEELDFFYQHDYKTNKERQETGLTLYNEFIKQQNNV
jgi:hypothetical protein